MMKVTAIIPNYNHSKYLKKRIESVLNQTYKNLEIIILDDYSTDNSLDIISQYKDYENVKIFANDSNSGSTFKQWNKGVKLASGDFIWIAESDDVAEPMFLENLISNVRSETHVAYCQSYRMDAIGNVTGNWTDYTESLEDFDLFYHNFELDGKEFIEKYLIHKNVIPNASAAIFRKSRFDEVGGADENVKYNSDWLFWIKMLTKGNVFYSSSKNNYFRYHDESVISTSGKKELFRKKYDILMRKRLNSFLKKNHQNTLLKLNNKLLHKETRQELRFFYERGFPLKSLRYFFKFYLNI